MSNNWTFDEDYLIFSWTSSLVAKITFNFRKMYNRRNNVPFSNSGLQVPCGAYDNGVRLLGRTDTAYVEAAVRVGTVDSIW